MQMKDKRKRIRLLPSLRQPRSNPEIRVPYDQTIEEQFIDMFRLSVRSDARIEAGRAAFN
jgi:hypothetical protein